MIVGSDIIYSRDVLKPLAQTIEHLLKKKQKAYIANNMVRYANYAAKFETELKNAGLTIERQEDIEDNRKEMRLLVITKE